MKKLFTLFVLLLAMTSCSVPQNANSQISQDQSSSTSVNVLNRDTKPFYVALRPEWSVYGSGNELGFYEIFENDDKSKSIFYTDYKTLKQVYLCAQPNCEHLKETCTSYIAPCDAKVTPAALNDCLLIVHEQGPNGAYIETANLDGSNKRTLYTFSSGERIERGVLANDDFIIILAQSINENTNAAQYALKAISLDGKTAEDIYYTQCKTSDLTDIGTSVLFLFGVTDHGIVVKEISIEDYETVENNSEKTLENMLQATKHKVLEIPFNGDPPKELLSYSQSESFEEALGGYVFYLQNNGEQNIALYKTNSQNAPVKIIDNFYTSSIAQILSKTSFDSFTIRDYLNNYLFINICTDYYTSPNGDAQVVYKQFAVDTVSGSIKEVTFNNYYKATEMPVQIVDVLENELLVHYSVEEKSVKGNKIPRLEKTLALINIEDFVNSVDNFREIDSIRKAD